MTTTTLITTKCINCDVVFSARAKNSETKRYCSKSCMIAYESLHGRPGRERSERIQFTCEQCKKEFTMLPGFLNAYRIKHGRDPRFCSRQCHGIARRTHTDEHEQFFNCEQCGKEVARRRYQRSTGHNKFYSQQRFCSPACKHAWFASQAERRFLAGEIGRHVKRNGYVWLSLPANLNGGTKGEILEHRWVMEQHLGRKLLPEETVHHVNGDRQHNVIENLELFSSRHGPGQRVADKVAFGIEMIALYPDFLTREDRERLKAIIERDG